MAVDETLIYEILKKIQADIAEIKAGYDTIGLRLTSIDAHMTGFFADGAA